MSDTFDEALVIAKAKRNFRRYHGPDARTPRNAEICWYDDEPYVVLTGIDGVLAVFWLGLHGDMNKPKIIPTQKSSRCPAQLRRVYWSHPTARSTS